MDTPDTWPADLSEWVHGLAGQVRDVVDDAEFPCADLPLLEQKDNARRLLDGHLPQSYHATRLLPHEADAIRSQGMRILDEHLVTDRLDAACRHGHLTDAERRSLLANRTLVGTALGLPNIGASVHYYAPIPSAHIERLIQPGDADYPSHPELPQK